LSFGWAALTGKLGRVCGFAFLFGRDWNVAASSGVVVYGELEGCNRVCLGGVESLEGLGVGFQVLILAFQLLELLAEGLVVVVETLESGLKTAGEVGYLLREKLVGGGDGLVGRVRDCRLSDGPGDVWVCRLE